MTTTKMTATKAEITQHRKNEQVIAEHYEEFFHVGQALAEIREAKTYKKVDGFATFDEYCRTKWDMNDSNARRYMRAAKIRHELPSPRNRDAASQFWSMRTVETIASAPTTAQRKKIAAAVIERAEENGKAPGYREVRQMVREETKAVLPPKPKAKKPAAAPLPSLVQKIAGWTRMIDNWSEALEAIDPDDWKTNTKGHAGVLRDFRKAVKRLENSSY